MMLTCAAWTLLLLSPAAAPVAVMQAAATQPAVPASVSAGKDERADQAATYYSRGRYVEAALEFEGLWRDFPGEPRFLFNAAASRYSAGHYAHTVAYLGEYLGRGEIGGDDRKEAQAQLDEARNKVASVQVVVSVPAGASGEVRVIAQHVARGASDLRPELVVPTRPHAGGTIAVVQLEPGSSWVVRAEAPGLTSEAQQVNVKQTTGQQVALQLTAVDAPAGPGEPAPIRDEGMRPATARKLKLGFVAGGGVAAAAGVVVLAVGASKRGRLADCDSGARGELACKQDLAAALRTRDAGAAVLGAGVGLLAGGLTWISGDARKRRVAWLVEASVGGLALIGGAAWLTVSSNKFNAANTAAITDWDTHYAAVGGSRGHAAAAGMFGLGAGLVGSAVTGLLVQRKRGGSAMARALRVDGMLGAGRGGLVLSGRF